MVQDLTIEDLARQSGLSLRTLRYYIQEGLLPGPDTAGKYASYSQEHLEHLAMIKRLKRLHLPLKEIRHLLSNMTPEDMRRILKYQDEIKFNIHDENQIYESPEQGGENRSSALEYIRDLEGRQARFRSLSGSPSVPASPQNSQPPLEMPEVRKPDSMEQPDQERWTKIILGEGVELNIREDKNRKNHKEIEELIKISASLFGGNKNRRNEK